MTQFNINPDLYESLQNENDRELFYFFKNDGLVTFEKKLAAGKILHQRRYDIDRLREEKAKLINKYSNRVKESTCSHSPEEIYKHKAKVRRKIIIGTALELLFLAAVSVICYSNSKPFELDIHTLSIPFLLTLSLFINIFAYRRKINKKKKEVTYSGRIFKARLAVIEREWKF